MRAALVVALLGFCVTAVGCDCSVPCVPAPVPAPIDPGSNVVIDAPSMSMTFFLPVVTCATPTPAPKQLTSQVLGPLNQTVTSSVELTGAVNPFAVALTFSSAGPGSYHAAITGDDNASAQFEIQVLADGTKRKTIDVNC